MSAIRKLDKKKLFTWQEIPMGGTILSEGSEDYETGSWRTKRPIFNAEACTNCMLCWLFCPECAILVEDKKVVGINKYLCKGCGICARECPAAKRGALRMEPGGQYDAAD